MNIGTSAFGLKIPIVKEGDDLSNIIIESLKTAYNSHEYYPSDNDIIGITESIVARSEGRYVTITEIVKDLKVKYPDNSYIIVYNPIFSRNRFSIILRAFARYFNHVIIVCNDIDEVGNTIAHEVTNVNYMYLYNEICKEENCRFTWTSTIITNLVNYDTAHINIIDCTLHKELANNTTINKIIPLIYKDSEIIYYTLKNICTNVSKYGLLGSNKVNEEKLKLYPDENNQEFVDNLRIKVMDTFGLSNVDVMIYGDGCYKDAATGIWEFADPVVSPAYTSGLEGSPAELKLKYLADNEFDNLSGDELTTEIKNRIKNKNVVQGTMETQGTTPRQYTNLLGSLMDLISGSGDKGTPVVVVQNYFKNYAQD